MKVQSISDLLAGHELFAGLDEAHLADIAGCGVNVRYPSGAYLFREGDSADQFYVVRKGRVALELFAPGRGAGIVETVGPGGVAGIDWLVTPYRWTTDGRAVEDVAAIAFDGRCIRQWCDTDPRLGYHLMQRMAGLLGQRLRSTRLRLFDVYGTGHVR